MNPTIIIVNIANGDPDLLNIRTVRILQECRQLVLRTAASPLVQWLDQNKIPYSSLDDLYETSEDFDQLLSLISERLWKLARKRQIVYAVSDSITDASVKELFHSKPSGGKICVIPGTGISDVFCSASLSLISGSDLRIVSATDFLSGEYNPCSSVLITELDSPLLAGEIKIQLSPFLSDETDVYYFRNLSTPVRIPLFELDRQHDTDHLSAVLIPGKEFTERNRFIFSDLLHIMERLRLPDGCPWDRIQTHESIRSYLIEEAWECIDCIDRQDSDHLCEELGDLLFQIVFHSSIAKSYDEFTINDVITSICSKMIRRHPYVFGNNRTEGSESLQLSWEKLKQEESGRSTVVSGLDDVSPGLPGLKYASKILERIVHLECIRPYSISAVGRLHDLVHQLQRSSGSTDADTLGRLLLLCTEICCLYGYDSELILHQAAERIKCRLQAAEKQIVRDGKSMEHLTFEELGVYLNHVEGETE